jgi:hypothetical protein
MNWEERLRGMIVAGGALVAAACSPSHDAGVCNTCNDPCCGTCGSVSMTPACEQWMVQEMACQDAGGTLSGDGVCMVPSEAGSPDRGLVDAGPLDAEAGPSDAALMEGQAGPADASAE